MNRGRMGFRRTIRTTFAVAAVAAVAAAPGHAAPGSGHGNGHGKPQTANNATLHGDQTAQGVVQSVSPRAVVLKLLDGSSTTIPVDGKTRVLVDGKPSALSDVKPGFVATATVKDGKPTQDLQAFDPSAQGAGMAVVQSVAQNGVAVTAADGTSVTIHANPKTRVFVNGKPASLHDVKPGFTIVIADGTKGGKPAAELHFLRPS